MTFDECRKEFEDWYKKEYWNFTYGNSVQCSYDATQDKYNHHAVDLAYNAYKQGNAAKADKSDMHGHVRVYEHHCLWDKDDYMHILYDTQDADAIEKRMEFAKLRVIKTFPLCLHPTAKADVSGEALPNVYIIAELLNELGWRSPYDAQWDNLKKSLPKLAELLHPATPDPRIAELEARHMRHVFDCAETRAVMQGRIAELEAKLEKAKEFIGNVMILARVNSEKVLERLAISALAAIEEGETK